MRLPNLMLTACAGLLAHAHSGSLPIAPKVLLVNLYADEAEAFYNSSLHLLAHNVTVPGLSPLFPAVHCTNDRSVCQVTTGEAEINAAASITALAFSPLFDLRKTYVYVAGVAGIDPAQASTGSVTFARFAVQVALQYEIDQRETNFSSEYIPQGTKAPQRYPTEIYGTEVFELNAKLRDTALGLVQAAHVKLNDSAKAQAYRAKYASTPLVNGTNPAAAATKAPFVLACDTATSDVYYSGNDLNADFSEYYALATNGSGVYCTSQQEDNAVLEALLRGALAKRNDFARILIMRTASDYLVAPPGVSAADNLFDQQDGYEIALANLRIAGVPVIRGILDNWNTKFASGVKPENYIGDILGSLGGTPNYGTGPVKEPMTITKRRRAFRI